MRRGVIRWTSGDHSAQPVSAPNSPIFSARSSRLLTEDGDQRVPPRGVRSYIASSCAPICASVSSGLARLTPTTSVTSRSQLNLRPAGCSSAGSARSSATKRLTARLSE